MARDPLPPRRSGTRATRDRFDTRSRAIDRSAIVRGRHAQIGLGDWIDNLRGKHRNLPYGLYLPGDWSFRLVQHLKKNKNARGNNLSVWRADLQRVNGWNEDFESWGLEGVELGFRLRLAGLEPRLVIMKACTFHLFHPRIDRTRSRSARRAWDASKARHQPWCPNGLSKADAPPARA